MFLVDTNVWLERLLDQEKSEEVARFLNLTSSEHIFMTDFAFHSIAVILSRLNETEALIRFVKDTFIEGAVTLIRLKPEDTDHIIHVMREFNLDFDDAYQYTAAEKHDLTIVSFDADFDRTKRGRKTPWEVLQKS